MMYGPQKSDPCIVAEKPSNKPGQPGAETAERRQGAEGNAVEPSMCRTLCRGSMSQGLDRVREAAKANDRTHVSPPSPKVGARCVNCARRDLCGGQRVTAVPTAMMVSCPCAIGDPRGREAVRATSPRCNNGGGDLSRCV